MSLTLVTLALILVTLTHTFSPTQGGGLPSNGGFQGQGSDGRVWERRGGHSCARGAVRETEKAFGKVRPVYHLEPTLGNGNSSIAYFWPDLIRIGGAEHIRVLGSWHMIFLEVILTFDTSHSLKVLQMGVPRRNGGRMGNGDCGMWGIRLVCKGGHHQHPANSGKRGR